MNMARYVVATSESHVRSGKEFRSLAKARRYAGGYRNMRVFSIRESDPHGLYDVTIPSQRRKGKRT